MVRVSLTDFEAAAGVDRALMSLEKDRLEHDLLSSGTTPSDGLRGSIVPRPCWAGSSSRKLKPDSPMGELTHVVAGEGKSSSSNRLLDLGGGGRDRRLCFKESEQLRGVAVLGDGSGDESAEVRRLGVFVGRYLGMRVSASSVAIELPGRDRFALRLAHGMPHGCVGLVIAFDPGPRGHVLCWADELSYPRDRRECPGSRSSTQDQLVYRSATSRPVSEKPSGVAAPTTRV